MDGIKKYTKGVDKLSPICYNKENEMKGVSKMWFDMGNNRRIWIEIED